MKPRGPFFVLLLLSDVLAFAQPSPRIDSLMIRLRSEGPTTARVDLLLRSAFETLYADRDGNDSLWKAAQTLATALHYERGLAYAPVGQAAQYHHLGKYAEAIALLKESSARLDALGAEQGFSSPLGFLRVVYTAAGMQQEKFLFYNAALERYQRPGLEANLGVCHHALAGYYRTIRQYAPAVEHYMKARDAFMIGAPDAVLNETMVIGWAYEEWGNPKRAIPFLKEALDGYTELGDSVEVSEIHLHLADNELTLGENGNAKEHFERSRRYWHRLDPINLAIFRSRYVLALVGWGQLDSAGAEYRALRATCAKSEVPLSSFHGTCEADYCGYAYFRAIGRLTTADSCLHRALDEALRLRDLPLVLKYRKALMGRYLEDRDEHNAAVQSSAYVALNDSLQAVANADAVAAYEGQVKERESAMEIQRQQARVKQQRIVLMASAAVLLLLAALAWSVHKGKKRSDELLLNILPAEVAKELKATGSSAARHIEQATILFSDFKGFTEASEQLTPQELVEELDTCFKAFDAIITARGIEKIKTIGDAYMAAGGLPRKVASGVADVVQAALDMQEFMIKRKAERTALGRPAFDMRVGVHTGPVVAGIVGVKKFQYDIWGDTVNTASRMESSGEVGHVNISESTYHAIAAQRDWVFTPRGKVQAKGKGELEMYFVQRIQPVHA